MKKLFGETNMAQAVVDKVTLSYDMSLAEMLKACEPVAKVDPIAAEMLTEEYFPIKGTGEVLMPSLKRAIEISFECGFDKASAWLKKNGLRPATLPELLQFVVNNPNEAIVHPIAAICPVHITPTGWFKNWHGERCRSFVPEIINRTYFHNGTFLVNKGQPEIWLGGAFGCLGSQDFHLAVLPE